MSAADNETRYCSCGESYSSGLVRQIFRFDPYLFVDLRLHFGVWWFA